MLKTLSMQQLRHRRQQNNAIDLGLSTARGNIYTNGTIQTSDRNEKQDMKHVDTEQRVARSKGLLRKFRWKSSVADKGDDTYSLQHHRSRLANRI